MSEKPIENEATREARKRGAEGAFRPSMTADERQEAERVWEQIRDLRDEAPYREAVVDIIAAARMRWQNEALEEAEKLFLSWCADHGMRVQWAWEFQEKIRALKK